MTDTPIPEMVERVARAIYKSHLDNFSGPVTPVEWKSLPAFSKRYGIAQAIAAIEEMQVPSQAMMKAGEPWSVDGKPPNCWTAMIDAALGKA